jgi:hypothetical protein
LIKSILIGLALAVPALALAQAAPKAAKPAAAPAPGALTLNIEAFIAREVVEKGVKKKVLLSTERAVPGDAIVYILNYGNASTKPIPASIDDPVPNGVHFTGVAENWAVVSVDGGKTFGQLATLKIKKADGAMRAAVPQDVSNIRWKFAQPLAPGAKGRVMFYALVK